MAYTNRYTEEVALLHASNENGVSSEQNTGWIDVSDYHRIVVEIHATAVGTTLNADIEVATSSAGAGITNLTGKSITELDAAGNVAIEIQAEELNVSGTYYTHIQVETTPSGSCDYVVLVKGISPRYGAVTVANWSEVVT